MYITEFNGHLSLSMSSVIYCATLHLIAPTLHHIAPTLHQHCTNTAPTLHRHCTSTAPTLHHTAPHCTTRHHTAPHCTALHHTTRHKQQVAHKLGKLLSTLNDSCHVNLIPLNPTEGFDGAPTKAADCKVFVDILSTYGVAATPRVRRGIDIDAGCGQLKAKVNKVLGRGGAPWARLECVALPALLWYVTMSTLQGQW